MTEPDTTALRARCDRADRLDPFDQDAYNLGTNDIRAVIDPYDPAGRP